MVVNGAPFVPPAGVRYSSLKKRFWFDRVRPIDGDVAPVATRVAALAVSFVLLIIITTTITRRSRRIGGGCVWFSHDHHRVEIIFFLRVFGARAFQQQSRQKRERGVKEGKKEKTRIQRCRRGRRLSLSLSLSIAWSEKRLPLLFVVDARVLLTSSFHGTIDEKKEGCCLCTPLLFLLRLLFSLKKKGRKVNVLPSAKDGCSRGSLAATSHILCVFNCRRAFVKGRRRLVLPLDGDDDVPLWWSKKALAPTTRLSFSQRCSRAQNYSLEDDDFSFVFTNESHCRVCSRRRRGVMTTKW